MRAVRGWGSVAELTAWGFAQAPVVMANEAHNRLTRCVRTRETGIRMVHAAHQAGVRRLAMEALPWPASGKPGPIRAIPAAAGGYLAQPDIRRLIAAALDLGWTLWAYEAVIEPPVARDPAALLTMEVTNWREREQAQNLCRLMASAPAEPLLVWCGNGHAQKAVAGEWVPMGHHFATMSAAEPFVIDQTVTVDWPGHDNSWKHSLLATLSEVLAAHGGAAGVLRDQAPQPLDRWTGADALVVSTDNALT